MSSVVIAPDSFKGSLGAAAVARAIADGWRARRPGDEVTLLPLADGGEGTLDAFAAAFPDSRRVPLEVTGPDDRDVVSEWLLLPRGSRPHSVGIVELAATSGIELMRELRPLDAHTSGFGQAIRAALDYGVEELVLGIGSSASTDGGTGMLRALGAEFVDAGGATIPQGARGLERLARADLSRLAPLPPFGATVLSDVSTTLCGAEGAAALFGPQKGLTASWIPRVDDALRRYAGIVAEAAPAPGATDLTPGSGAAGGAGFALLSWGARLVAGSRHVAELVDLGNACAAADLVITGEGRFDAQSRMGKVPGTVLDYASGRPVGLISGEIAARADLGSFFGAVPLTALAPSRAAAMSEPERWLRAATARLADSFTASLAG